MTRPSGGYPLITRAFAFTFVALVILGSVLGAPPTLARAGGSAAFDGAGSGTAAGGGTLLARIDGAATTSVRASASTLAAPGTVWAWGYNVAGQLADGTITDRHRPLVVSTVSLTAITSATAIAAGDLHSLAVKSDGTVWAWGMNSAGELGDGTVIERHTAVQVSALTGVTAVAAGVTHSLALKNDGTVWAWGGNLSDQLGDGTPTEQHSPVQVSGGVTAIAAGASHCLAVKSDGTVWAWGQNGLGQLGDGTVTDRLAPVQVTVLTGVTAVVVRMVASADRRRTNDYAKRSRPQMSKDIVSRTL